MTLLLSENPPLQDQLWIYMHVYIQIIISISKIVVIFRIDDNQSIISSMYIPIKVAISKHKLS